MDEDTKQFVREEGEKTRRHMDVVGEGLEHKMQLVAEGVMTNSEKIDRMQGNITQINNRTEVLEIKMVGVEGKLEGIKGKIENIGGRVDNIGGDVKEIKHDMKQKVNRDELATFGLVMDKPLEH